MLEAYRSKGGSETNSTPFVNKLKEYMTDEIYCFKAAGLATIVMHKKKASHVLKLVNSKDEDEALETEKIAKKINAEIKEVPRVKEEYPVLDEETLQNTIIPTLNEILVSISPKFHTNPLAAALISNTVTSMTSSKVSLLQISLGLFVREKKIIECLQELGVTSSSQTLQNISSTSCE